MFGGGGSNTVLGATGATTLLQKLTRYAAIVFGVCCLLLAMNARRDAGSVFDDVQAAPAPAAPTTQTTPSSSSSQPQSEQKPTESGEGAAAPQQAQ